MRRPTTLAALLLAAASLVAVYASASTYMAEKDLVYVVVGDKATQLEEVKKFAPGRVTLLDATGQSVK